MTPAAEPSFMTTLIPIFLGGVVSSLLTLLVGQRLQHYFWRRQRQVEWQKTVIEDVNKLTTEVQFLLSKPGEDLQARDERLSMTLSAVIANARALFPPPNAAIIQKLHPIIAEALRLPAPSLPQKRVEVGIKLMLAHHMALIALYQDMGIPVRPHKELIALYRAMGIPIRTRGTSMQKYAQYWRERG